MGRLLVPVLVLMTATAGCATDAPGQAVPTPMGSSPAPSTSASPTGEAPPISAPELDLTQFEERVCDLLTPPQLAPFEIREPGTPGEDDAGPNCGWNPPDSSTGVRVDLTIISKVREGLEGIYARKDRFMFFEDAGEINGYPAVHLDTVSDGDEGVCTTIVGVRRDLAFEAIVHVNPRNSPEYRKPCSLSDKVASAVIDTVKGGR